jgi:tetratricopeptide (TPR) repeat protein
MAKKWKAFPHAAETYRYEGAALKKHWARLHAGDQEPFPKDESLQEAWRCYHAGDFAEAVAIGLEAGVEGYAVANKAAAIYANYLESDDTAKQKIFQEVAARAEEARVAQPKHANSHYLYAYAMGRYSQSISVATALAQGLGGKIKDALLTTLKLEPRHAEAQTAYGSYQAEVINKVGGMVAGLTYGAKKDSALEHFKEALKLTPHSAIARIEYANGLLLLFGNSKIDEATRLYEEAAACEPAEAMERLDVEKAKEELA